MSQDPTFMKFKHSPSIANIIRICKKNPNLKTIYLNSSAMCRISKTTSDLLKLLKIEIKETEGAIGRPKFKSNPQLMAKCQRLKDSGIGLTIASKKLKIPESTLYTHIWKKLE